MAGWQDDEGLEIYTDSDDEPKPKARSRASDASTYASTRTRKPKLTFATCPDCGMPATNVAGGRGIMCLHCGYGTLQKKKRGRR